jgi:hypothetical protein
VPGAERDAMSLTNRWPGMVLRRVVTDFSAPGDVVAFADLFSDLTDPFTGPAGAPDADRANDAAADAVDHTAGDAADDSDDRADETAGDWAGLVCEAARKLGRDARVIACPLRNSCVEPASSARSDTPGGPPALVVIAAPPVVDAAREIVGPAGALPEALLPRPGGVLVVLTRTDRVGGRLIDPSWSIVARARRAGARYVAHVVAVHIAPPAVLTASSTVSCAVSNGGPDDTEHGEPGSRQRAVDGAGHLLAHRDVLVFLRPTHSPDSGATPLARPTASQRCAPGTGSDGAALGIEGAR